MLRQWVAGCVCLASHCSACECAWHPFSTTQGAVLTLHVTQDRFMALLHSTQLLLATACVYTAVCVYMCVMYRTSSIHVCIHVHLCL